jgi:Holliday junction resolvase RusA-like endonuclease
MGSFDEPVKVAITLSSRTSLRGDIDNYAKSILDGIVKGELIRDDNLIEHLVVTKLPNGESDGVWVVVESISD